jgi:hypothetical protein
MAKALYYRGTAYRKQGKPAQAISDLTTAVWLKGGLSDTDRAQAMEQRQLAYSEAGLGSQAPAIGAAPLDAPAAKPVQQAQAPAAGTAAPPPPPAPKPGVLVATVPPKSSFFSMPTMPSISMPTMSMPSIFGGGSSSSPAPAPAALAPAATPDTSWQTATAAAEATPASIPSPGFAVSEPTAAPAAPQQQAALAPAPQTETSSAPNTLAGTGAAISGFFGGIFGGGSGASAPATGTPSSPLATGSTGPAHGDTPWDGATVVAQTSSMVQRGPEEPPAPLPWSSGQTVAAAEPAAAVTPVKSAAAPAGKYKLQVAAVRSREEAEKLAASLNGYQAVQTGVVQPEIDEAVIGSMGTFYRVRLGPYADAKEPGQLCKTLRPQGFDCMVVTQ